MFVGCPVILSSRVEFRLQFLDGGQGGLQAVGKTLGQPELRDSHRFPDVAKRVLHHNAFLGATEDQANARLIVGMTQEIIDRGQVEV